MIYALNAWVLKRLIPAIKQEITTSKQYTNINSNAVASFFVINLIEISIKIIKAIAYTKIKLIVKIGILDKAVHDNLAIIMPANKEQRLMFCKLCLDCKCSKG